MITIDVKDWNSQKVGLAELDEAVFDRPLDRGLLHSIVRWQLAKKRQGTHQAKTRSMVSGSSKKPFKQKGTGNARQGHKRSPLMEGGAVVHGPQPRDYSYKLNKKTRALGLSVSLSHLKREGKIVVLDSVDFEPAKTKALAKSLEGLGVSRAVLIANEQNSNTLRAARNLATVKVLPTVGVNVYDLLKYGALVVSKESLLDLQKRCGGGQ